MSGGGREIHSPAGNGFGSSALTGASENHPGWDMKPQWGMRSHSDYWNSRQQPGLFPSGLPSLLLYHCPVSLALGAGFPPRALLVWFFLKVTAFGAFSFFSGLILLPFGCLGRKMLYIKIVIILFHGSVESIFSSLQVCRPL